MKRKLPLNLSTKPKKKWIILLCLFIFSFLLYVNTIDHDYALDDTIVFKENVFVQQGIKGIGSLITTGFQYGFTKANDEGYRPLGLINFAIEKELFGNNPHVSHFFNVLFYALTSVLLFLLLCKLFKNYAIVIPLLISLLFIAHPIHTEVVANIKSRDEILCFLFAILSLIFLLDYYYKSKIKFRIYSFIAYFLCLMSKEQAITLVAVVPLILHFFTDKSFKKIIRLSLPYLGIVLIYLLLRTTFLDTIAFSEEIAVINNSLMAAKNTSEMFATNFVILGEYLRLLFFPHPLSWDYSYNQIPIVNWSNIKAITSLLIYIGLGIYCIKRIKKKDTIAFGILFFLITLSIVSNLFIKINSTLGERFLYIPSLGFCIAIVMLLIKIMRINPTRVIKNKSILLGILVSVIIIYSFKTISRNADWKNNFTLFLADVKSCPNSAITHLAAGNQYRNAGEQESNVGKRNILLLKAINEYKLSIEIYPQYSPIYYELGVTYGIIGDKENALNAYQKVILLDPWNKKALNNLGMIYIKKKDYDNALKYFLKVFEIDKSFGNALSNIGNIYLEKMDYDNALKYFLKVPEMHKSYVYTCANIGKIYFEKKDYNNAIVYYEKVIAINPNSKNVYNNLVSSYNSIGNVNKAKYYSRKAKQLE